MTALAFDVGVEFAADPGETFTMTDEELFDVADYATRIVLRSHQCSPEDRDDARQAAALEVWTVYQRRRGQHRGYYFTVARYALYDWLKAQRYTTYETPFDSLEWCLTTREDEQDQPWIDEATLRDLAPDLGISEREVVYLVHRLSGCTLQLISEEMGVSIGAVEGVQRRLLYRLRLLARGISVSTNHPHPSHGEIVYRQIHRWRAIELPWSEIATRLQISAGAAESAYRRWCKREEACRVT